MKNKQYNIFISYRREGGEDKARNLNQHLSSYGYNVFFDHEAGIRQEFETEILAAVEIAPIFLLLLTPHSLDRCINEEDWVRREVELAIRCHKEIIPIRPNYNFEFTDLPVNIPNSIMELSRLQFAEIDFHQNFRATVNQMIEERIKPIIQPSFINVTSSESGAIVHFFSDISCRVMHYGKQLAVTDAKDQIEGATTRLLKGRHLLNYISIEHEEDSYKEVLSIPDNEYEDFVQISLQGIKEERIKKDAQLMEEQLRVAEAEKKRRLSKQNEAFVLNEQKYLYDLFFSYSLKDASFVRKAYYFLKEAGYKCWLDIDQLSEGNPFNNAKDNPINNSRCILLFHSENTNDSEWINHELRYAFHMKKLILPILLDNSSFSPKIDYWISMINWLDLSKEDKAQWMSLLLKAISSIIK